MVLQPESRKLGLRLLCPVPVPKPLPIKAVSSRPQSIPPPETGAPGNQQLLTLAPGQGPGFFRLCKATLCRVIWALTLEVRC